MRTISEGKPGIRHRGRPFILREWLNTDVCGKLLVSQSRSSAALRPSRNLEEKNKKQMMGRGNLGDDAFHTGAFTGWVVVEVTGNKIGPGEMNCPKPGIVVTRSYSNTGILFPRKDGMYKIKSRKQSTSPESERPTWLPQGDSTVRAHISRDFDLGPAQRFRSLWISSRPAWLPDWRDASVGTAFSYMAAFGDAVSAWLMLLYDFFYRLGTVDARPKN